MCCYSSRGRNTQQEQVEGRKSKLGRFKCNIDTSFPSPLDCVGFKMCIWDAEECFVLAKTLWSNPISPRDIGEALQLLHALPSLHDLRLSNVNFELDAKKIVDHYNKDSILEFGAIFYECKRCCHLFFENSHAEFNQRQTNEAFHTLARNVSFLTSLHIFIDATVLYLGFNF